MKEVGKLRITLPSERDIAMTRVLAAPRQLVYEAFTRPELLRRWLGVHNDWTFAVCEIDLRVGGSYRYVWRRGDGFEMGMGGVYLEILPGKRIVASERFDDSWYEGEAVGTTEFTEQGGRTTVVMTVRYSSQETRDAVLQSPMESGVAAGFDALERLLPTIPAA